jgi:hypothetical protein
LNIFFARCSLKVLSFCLSKAIHTRKDVCHACLQQYTVSSTSLVAKSSGTQKAQSARKDGKHVVSPDWLMACKFRYESACKTRTNKCGGCAILTLGQGPSVFLEFARGREQIGLLRISAANRNWTFGIAYSLACSIRFF